MEPRPGLVLASGSPRRRDLLAQAGIAFEVIPADIPEERRPDEPPAELVRRLALEKAEAVAARLQRDSPDPQAHPGEPPESRPVLGSDTVVVLEQAVLGKPRDAEHAVALLRRLTGRTHRVVTGVALVEPRYGRTHVTHVESRVVMRPAEEAEIRRYVAGGEPLDKAGAYALQGEGARFVERVEGSRTNVIGLPMDETLAMLRAVGLAQEAP